MASCNWQKLDRKTLFSGGYAAHFENALRARMGHSNTDIDKSCVSLNSVYGPSWSDAKREPIKRVEQIDKKEPPKRLKAERKVACMMWIPCPDSLTDVSDKFFDWMWNELQLYFGKENVISMNVHRDERHEYTDYQTKQKRMSLHHAHALIVPYVKGIGVNGKNFFTKQAFRDWQHHLDIAVRQDWGIDWGTNSPYTDLDVDTLKEKSKELANNKKYDKDKSDAELWRDFKNQYF